MLFFACRSKGIGNHSRLLSYEIPDQEIGPEPKQRNVPVRAILGQYSSGLPVLRFKSVIAQHRRAVARRVRLHRRNVAPSMGPEAGSAQ